MSEKFNTGKVRISYPHVFERDQNDKFSLVALIPKTDTKTLEKIEEACKAVYREHKSGVLKGLEYEEVAKPFHDGDGRKPKGGSYGDECKGMIVLSAKSKTKPVVVDRNGEKTADESLIYPGTWGRVAIAFSAYNNSGNRGICCFLNGVKTYTTGERFGSTFKAEDFDDGYDDSDMLTGADDDDEI